ncbi:SDR family oxidoreductase [Rhizobium leguminosarum]|uniref:SDR family oxidoreductase n=1 Tax=Rhizobium leguminosarum TaxID=384 RepID=UPI000FEC574E|nr:SDR family oxidoreductase [Rhizobium leguminosarum]RWX12879.1 SDR family oxidoreductase [Rhizobium leguminosarum]
MKTAMITGAGRGIGLALTTHYLEASYAVIAGVRDVDKIPDLAPLHANQDLEIVQLDIAAEADIDSLRTRVAGRPIDILINNAGVGGPSSGDAALDADGWLKTFDVNCIGATRVALAVRESLQTARGKVAAISSSLGSIALAEATGGLNGGALAYRSSKAALNMSMRLLALALKPDGISVALICPGWVRTSLGGPDAPLPPEQSAAAIASVIEGLEIEVTGSFLSHEGTAIPW